MFTPEFFFPGRVCLPHACVMYICYIQHVEKPANGVYFLCIIRNCPIYFKDLMKYMYTIMRSDKGIEKCRDFVLALKPALLIDLHRVLDVCDRSNMLYPSYEPY